MTQPLGRNGFTRGATLVLITIVIGLVIIPFFLIQNSEFRGADGAAQKAIVEIAPTTRPWFQPLWTPPGRETESLLFALQAALGAGVIGYFFGLKRGQGHKPVDASQMVEHNAWH